MEPIEFVQALREQGIVLSPEQQQQFQQYYQLLVTWNEKMNLTAITAEPAVYLKHFFDSLTLAWQHDFSVGQPTLCDVGSGAGFPSIPLKIVYPNLQITIVDSLQKRIAFLQAVVEQLSLEGVHLFHSRAEDFGQEAIHREQYDFVTARAVARLNVLTELCVPLVKRNGYFLAMKATKSEEEVVEATPAIALLGGELIAVEPVSLPGTEADRYIVTIKKRKATPKKYPRKAGLPNKKPLK